MDYQWTDVIPLAELLSEHHATVDPQYVRFTDLHQWICALPGFKGDPQRSNERILEAIQMAWIEEVAP
jgi:FeS assembly protein IscX